ncbi:HTH domain-containing protein [Haloarcula nitratireducens]|uniref:HTH domain-containing protein n=1 Tax=Haloarcula nitratireducens TaxID=2487749 RepID=UPI002E2DCE7B|nr:HTH domain-containing protein [Halomicroarcula nitratireducens]
MRQTDEKHIVERSAADGLTVDLWTRRPVCGPRTTVIDRLGSLRTAEVIDDFSVTTWPEEIVVSGRTNHSELLDIVEEFEEWASENGLTLRPPFETRTASLLVGESEEVLTTPMMLAAAYDGDDLVGVYPCTDGERTRTIGEFLDALGDDEASLDEPDGDLVAAVSEHGTP